MKEETFNMGVRKFLKKVGVTSQREIEKSVDEALQANELQGNETLHAKVILEVSGINLNTVIEGEINLE